MKIKSTLLALLAGAAIVVGACGGSTASPSASAAAGTGCEKAIAAGEPTAVGRELHRRHPVGMLADPVFQTAVPRAVNLQHAIGTAERNPLLVRAEIGGQHRVVLITHRDDPLTAGDIPDDDAARMPAASASRQQQPAHPANW